MARISINLLLLLMFVVTCTGWDLSLVHVNDIHVRMEETNKYSAACRQDTNSIR
jgi:hypothetical protein